MTIPETVIAMLGTAAGGGGGLGLLHMWMNRQKEKKDASRLFRDELREEASGLREHIEALKDEITEKENELDIWREKYWKLYVEHNLFMASVNAVLVKNGIDPELVLPKPN